MADVYPRSTTLTRHKDTYPFISPSKFTGRLQGNVILLTGAGRGIGRATALALASAGASLALLSRTASELSSLAAEIALIHSSGPTFILARDVLSDPFQIVVDVENALGPIDILINNAGNMRLGPVYKEKDMDIWWHVQELSVKAPMALIHACLPRMLERGKGKVITLGSAAADNSFPFQSAYGAAKAALLKAHQCLDIEMRGNGIVFYCIHPGGNATSTLGRGDGVNLDAMGLPEVQRFCEKFVKTAITDTLELAANSIVFLAVDEMMEVFSGRYLDCCQDMEELFQNRERILLEELNMLRVNLL
jgi:NADP-dependent 3-hydroxy acid dehydrogenase YdfG